MSWDRWWMETDGKQWLAMMVSDIVYKVEYQYHGQNNDRWCV